MSEHEELTGRIPVTSPPMKVEVAEPWPSSLRISSADGRMLLAIHSDGQVDGEAADASEAARLFAREVMRIQVSAESEAHGAVEENALHNLRAYLAKTLSNIEGTNHPWSVVDVRAFIQDALALGDEIDEAESEQAR